MLYPEYVESGVYCRFNNCIHINEPDCEVKERVSENIFSKERYLNYKKLYHELEERDKMRK